MKNTQKKYYIRKLFASALFFVLCLSASAAALMSRTGALYLNSDDYSNAHIQLAQVEYERSRYETAMGDVFDCSGIPIVTGTGLLKDSGYAEYDPTFSYLLGNTNLDDRRLLNANSETLLTPCGTTEEDGTPKGCSIRLTIDSDLQLHIASQLEGKRASAVVLSRKSGALKALAGSYKDDFDLGSEPDEKTLARYNKSDEPLWIPPYLTDDTAPGSVYKIFTSALILENGDGDEQYEDIGYLEFPEGKLYNNNEEVYGTLDLTDAFVHSVNTYFGSAYASANLADIRDLSDRLMLNHDIETDFGTVSSHTIFRSYSSFERASTGFGQGCLQLNNVSLAMMTQGVLEGRIYRPHVLDADRCTAAPGELISVESTVDEEIISDGCVSAETSKSIEELMGAAARNYQLPDMIKGAKTGTADLSEGTRATMIAFNDDYIIVVSELSNDSAYGISQKDTVTGIFAKLVELGYSE